VAVSTTGRATGHANGGPTGRARTTAPVGAPVEFHTPVRGHAFAALPPGGSAELDVDTPVALRREPANPADPLAVGVWLVDGDGPRWRLGYLDRTVAARLAPRMDAGAEVEGVLHGWVDEPEGRWRRPLVRVRITVPEPRGSAPVAARRPSLRALPPGTRRRRLPRR
jgi:hypothetical protein